MTGNAKTVPGSPPGPSLGRRLRDLRNQAGLSLSELAARTGLARSTLYKVENSGMSLTYDKLISLGAGLGIEVGQLFEDGPAPARSGGMFMGRRDIGCIATADVVSTKSYDYMYLCTGLRHKRMVPMYGEIKAKTLEEFGELLSHPGEEFTYVISGAIEVHTKFYSPTRLEAGEYIYLDSTMPHAYLNAGKDKAIVICVCSSPDENLSEELPKYLR